MLVIMQVNIKYYISVLFFRFKGVQYFLTLRPAYASNDLFLKLACFTFIKTHSLHILMEFNHPESASFSSVSIKEYQVFVEI